MTRPPAAMTRQEVKFLRRILPVGMKAASAVLFGLGPPRWSGVRAIKHLILLDLARYGISYKFDFVMYSLLLKMVTLWTLFS